MSENAIVDHEGLNDADREAILFGNAGRFYTVRAPKVRAAAK